MHLQESARDKHVYDASKAIKKEERADSPNLVIKQEPLSDVIVDTALKSLFRTVTENGREVFELLDSDEEMELADLSEDRGMSSDTMVASGDFDVLKMDLDDDLDDSDEPHLFQNSGYTSSDSSSDSGIDCDTFSEPSSNWLDDGILSTVKQGPIKITRQCTVDAVEYISDLPTYWPVPRNKRAYVVDLSDPKFDVYDKNGRLMTVDALIKNAVSAHYVHSSLHVVFKYILRNRTRGRVALATAPGILVLKFLHQFLDSTMAKKSFVEGAVSHAPAIQPASTSTLLWLIKKDLNLTRGR